MTDEELKEKIFREKGNPWRKHETKELIDYAIKKAKQQERERINKKIDEVYEKETNKYNYVEIYNFVQKLKKEI